MFFATLAESSFIFHQANVGLLAFEFVRDYRIVGREFKLNTVTAALTAQTGFLFVEHAGVFAHAHLLMPRTSAVRDAFNGRHYLRCRP
jgi:hypothetical protein